MSNDNTMTIEPPRPGVSRQIAPADEQPNRTESKHLTGSDLRDGYTVCACGKYAYIYRVAVLRRLPDGYAGELCPKCHFWMCAVNKLDGAGRPDEKARL